MRNDLEICSFLAIPLSLGSRPSTEVLKHRDDQCSNRIAGHRDSTEISVQMVFPVPEQRVPRCESSDARNSPRPLRTTYDEGSSAIARANFPAVGYGIRCHGEFPDRRRGIVRTVGFEHDSRSHCFVIDERRVPTALPNRVRFRARGRPCRDKTVSARSSPNPMIGLDDWQSGQGGSPGAHGFVTLRVR